ncbi:MAG: pantoate--beta-alanine ligase [Syntrophobacteraceae bacterium]|nr:pantoate--beta-alanine ligase [Desulfobacteraceae bacterium]
MRIIESITEMQQQADAWRREEKRIGLVPTLGYLHAGHQKLMEAARKHADVVVMSVFVNPTQFVQGEDFELYPRDLDHDARLGNEVGVDVIFAPQVAEMYPDGYQTHVEVTRITLPLCGRHRPGHFRGVTTVVTKLFNIVKPHIAVFGEKDFQQLAVVRRMVRDLSMDVKILSHPIVRETDGLAMSSRNTLLTPEEREQALLINRSLREAQALVAGGVRSAEEILDRVRSRVSAGKGMNVDYIELRDPESFEEVARISGPALLAMAVRIGKTRLIDNCVLQAAVESP